MRTIAGLFSLFMPGFGQYYNRQFVKGTVFFVVEYFVNFFGKINNAILLDLIGYHKESINTVVYDHMMYYPVFYAYVVWDAWYYAKNGANKTTTAIPFLAAGICGEMAAIYSRKFPIPALTVGLILIIPMLLGMFIFRKE